ncbi:hypothetical protein GGR55DRAFT_604561 [Xylaria sp. FL0064]|nr:hypothetical protein GGR55DRAFT_604561 [Xylaria sp. FL0064]
MLYAQNVVGGRRSINTCHCSCTSASPKLLQSNLLHYYRTLETSKTYRKLIAQRHLHCIDDSIALDVLVCLSSRISKSKSFCPNDVQTCMQQPAEFNRNPSASQETNFNSTIGNEPPSSFTRTNSQTRRTNLQSSPSPLPHHLHRRENETSLFRGDGRHYFRDIRTPPATDTRRPITRSRSPQDKEDTQDRSALLFLGSFGSLLVLVDIESRSGRKKQKNVIEMLIPGPVTMILGEAARQTPMYVVSIIDSVFCNPH